MMHALLFDVTRCKGCEQCVAACNTTNRIDPRQSERDRALVRDGLSSDRLCSLIALEGGRFARKSCMHCLEPSCAEACLVGGLTRTPQGPVIYDPDKCIGCRYCMLACPFHIPRYEWEKRMPFVRKCDLCFDRLGHGLPPACAEACPEGALLFGERGELLAIARERLAQGPQKYLPRIWGEHEYGGTSVIYISDCDLDELGWPAGNAAPIPSLTKPLISATPFIGSGVAACLLGIHWVIKRRMKRAGEEEEKGGSHA